MAIKALVIPVEGPLVEQEIDDRLETLQELVCGGYVQHVACPPNLVAGAAVSTWMNEEAKFREDLAPNMRATDFLVPGVGLFLGDYISGPMLLTGDDGEGGLADVPEAAVERARLIEEEAG